MENVDKLMETAVECLKTPGTTSSSLENSENYIFGELIAKKNLNVLKMVRRKKF